MLTLTVLQNKIIELLVGFQNHDWAEQVEGIDDSLAQTGED
jgi:hypothetical protein